MKIPVPSRRIPLGSLPVLCGSPGWFVGVALALFSSGCSPKPSAAGGVTESPDPTVTQGRIAFPANSPQLGYLAVEAVQPAPTRTLHFPGRLTWDDNRTVRVFSPFAGRVTRIGVSPGDAVEKGGTLAWVSSPDFGQAQADARRAATDVRLAERTLARVRELQGAGAAPLKDVANAEADLARAQAESQRAESRLALFGPHADAIDNAFALQAPLGGVVVEKNLNPGQEVRPDQMLASVERLAAPLFVITDPTRLWLLLDVTEGDVRHLAVGQPVTLHSLGDPTRTVPGVLRFIGDALDPATRAFKVRVEVENDARHLKAEMLVEAEVGVDVPGAFTVPDKAVFFRGDRHYVFTEVSPSTFGRREVQVGAREKGRIQVVGGLREGDRVVSTGAMLLEQIRQGSEGG